MPDTRAIFGAIWWHPVADHPPVQAHLAQLRDEEDKLYFGSYLSSASCKLLPNLAVVPDLVLPRFGESCDVPGASGSPCVADGAVAGASDLATAVSDDTCFTAALVEGIVSEEAAFSSLAALALVDSSDEPSSKMSVNMKKNGPADASWIEAVDCVPRLRPKTGADGVADRGGGSGGGGGGGGTDTGTGLDCCGDSGSSGGGGERRLR